MSDKPSTPFSEKQLLALQAYHDGELWVLGRWRVARALRGSPALRHELAQLQNVSGWMQKIESEQHPIDSPDTWSEIGPALSRIDAEVGSAVFVSRSRTRASWHWGSLLAGGAVAAVLLLAVVLDNGQGIPEHRGTGMHEEIAGGALRYLQTYGVSTVVSQDSEDVTIIWLMDVPEMAEGA